MKRLSAARGEILERVRVAQKILIFLDYDGTLVPIQPSPELARLSPERKKLLFALVRLPKFKVGILTGRSLPDIRKAAGLSNLFYAANYGLKIETPQKSWVHPEAQKRSLAIKKMLPLLRRMASGFRGVRIEDKALTVAVHFRQYQGRPELLERKLVKIIGGRPGQFRLTTGKKIFEVYPAVKWDKGKSLLKAEKMLGFRRKPLVIFIGDDRADEEAFRQMGSKDISVAVGRREKTAARYFCKSSVEVVRFLKLLLKAGAERRTGG